jgi:sec1 family domain-containing protein 1
MVARKLNRMIAEHPTLLRNKSSSTRPLLVILDRTADLITPIQHTSTYQALIDDLLQHTANRVEFEVVQDPDAKRPKKIQKRFDLDPDTDPFYAAHKFQPFPEAIEMNGSELQEVTAREQEIRSKAVGGGGTNAFSSHSSDPLTSGSGTTDLATAVDSLPALLDRKKQLEVHTSILQAVMNEVAARDVPQFYELESTLATGSFKNDAVKAKKDVLALVGDQAKGNVEDKVRLAMVYALATGAKTADLDQVTAALQQACEAKIVAATVGAEDQASVRSKLATGLKALGYLKQLRSMHMIPAATDMVQELQSSTSDHNRGKSSSSGSTMLSSLVAKATTQATGLLAKATDRVSSMLGKIHKHHATVVVENLCEMKAGSEDETYLYLDPKAKGGDVDVVKLQGVTRATVREAIAFVIGGGSYGEYQNLQMLADERRQISYGSTELLDASSFLSQLGQLGG